jgi:hypothetical protein
MVITMIRFSGRKSRSVNMLVKRSDLRLQKSARYRTPRKKQEPKPSTLGFWFSSGPVPRPGTNGLMTHNQLLTLEPSALYLSCYFSLEGAGFALMVSLEGAPDCLRHLIWPSQNFNRLRLQGGLNSWPSAAQAND